MNEPLTSSERALKSFAFGPFRFRVADLQLFRGRQAVPLPPKTAEMLWLLVHRRGEVVSKETMMTELWPSTFVEESNLAQHVFRLRKALGERYIETIPRRGYRFVANVTEVTGAPRAPRWIAATFIVAVTTVLSTRGREPHAIAPATREAYLKGTHHWNRRTGADFRKAIEYFRMAVEEDPAYADAWAGLAHAYNFTGQAPRAKVAAMRALEFDPRSAQAHAALGNVSLFHDFDFDAAERALRRAIELDPGYATAHQWLAFAFLARRKIDAARMEIERARRLDPSSLIINTDVGDIEYYAHRYDDAIRAYGRALELDPNFAQAHASLAMAYRRKGMIAESRVEFGVFARLVAPGDTTAYAWARTCGDAGDSRCAIEHLERAYANREGNLALIHVEPAFDAIRGDARFVEFLRRRRLAL